MMPEDAAGVLIAAAKAQGTQECVRCPLVLLASLSLDLRESGSGDAAATPAEAAAAAEVAERIAGDGVLMEVVRRQLSGSDSYTFEPALRVVDSLLSHHTRRRPREAAAAAIGDGSSVLRGGGGARQGDPHLDDRLSVLARLLATCTDEQHDAVVVVVVEHGVIPLLLKALTNQDFSLTASAITVLVTLCSCPLSRAAVAAHPAALATLADEMRAAGAAAGVADGKKAHGLASLANDALLAIRCLIAHSAAAGDAFAAMALAPSGSSILGEVARQLATPVLGAHPHISPRRPLRVLSAAATALDAITRAACRCGRLAALQKRRPLVLGAAQALVRVAHDLNRDGHPRGGGPPERNERWVLQAAEMLLAALDCFTDATADGGGADAALGALRECGLEALQAFSDAVVRVADALLAVRPGAGSGAEAHEQRLQQSEPLAADMPTRLARRFEDLQQQQQQQRQQQQQQRQLQPHGSVTPTSSDCRRGNCAAPSAAGLAACSGREPREMGASSSASRALPIIGERSEQGRGRASGNECAACAKTPADGARLRLCRGCRSVRYCSLECMRSAWPGHRQACQERQAAAASAAAAPQVI
jgi:hypothetical protein